MDKSKERIVDCIVGTFILMAMITVMYLLFGGWITFFYAAGMSIICVWVSLEIKSAYVEEAQKEQKRLKENPIEKRKTEPQQNPQLKSKSKTSKQETNKIIDRI